MTIHNTHNPTRDVVCCASCGRDTTAKSGLCHRCTGHGFFGVRESKGRKQRALQSVDATDEAFRSYVEAKEQQQ